MNIVEHVIKQANKDHVQACRCRTLAGCAAKRSYLVAQRLEALGIDAKDNGGTVTIGDIEISAIAH